MRPTSPCKGENDLLCVKQAGIVESLTSRQDVSRWHKALAPASLLKILWPNISKCSVKYDATSPSFEVLPSLQDVLKGQRKVGSCQETCPGSWNCVSRSEAVTIPSLKEVGSCFR